ncbi:MAG TPA: hypothetical protein VEU62_09315, partial [Bryobacterales bacterium]|nr:hypothetical protein [Bryobacterales bacterium]
MRRPFKISLAVLALLLLTAGAGLLVLRTAWFREKLRQRVIAELENATGGRVEITRVRFNVPHWRGRLEGLTIYGSEEPGQPPLLHAAALEVDLKVVS